MMQLVYYYINPIALAKAKIVYNFGLGECTMVNPVYILTCICYCVIKYLF